MMGRKGFTLTEVLMAVVVVGILASAAVANYRTAILRSRYDAARIVLLQIYAGEQYYLDNVSPGGNTYVTSAALVTMADWRNSLNMDNPNIPPGPVAYSITTGAGPSFTATATFNGQTQTVDNNKTLGGTWVRGT